MMLIPREELLLAVIEGNVIFWCAILMFAGLWQAVAEAIEYARGGLKRWRNERRLNRILLGKEAFKP